MRKKALNIPLVSIFVLAVLVPSIALSALALRAADRESVYVEKRLESALLAEVGLAGGRINEVLSDAVSRLRDISFEFSSDTAAWSGADPIVGVPFKVEGGRMDVPEYSDAPDSKTRIFMETFGPFLLGGSSLPAYDSLARIYRRDFAEPPEPVELPGSVRRSEDGASYSDLPLPAPSASALFSAAPEKTAASRKQVSGMEMQLAESSIASDTRIREEAFKQAESEGFEILKRNVMPQARPSPAAVMPQARASSGELSRTVARSRTMRELAAEADHGLLPYLGDDGLALLFWATTADGTAGCTLDMDELKDRIAGAIPASAGETRILNVLDEAGKPLIELPGDPGGGKEANLAEGVDWRRPFVAMEISPLLPRWEVGAWLVNQEALASRVRSVKTAIWLLVVSLFIVIAVGGFAVIRIVSSEARIARQKTTFVANVSHELKTPLTSIRLFAELLMSGRQPDEKKRAEYLRTMVSETERLSSLVENVLAFAKSTKKEEGGAMERRGVPLDLSALAEDTLAQFRPHIEREGFSVSFSACGPLPVRGDRERLRQLLMNLLSNAEKYSDEEKDISVECLEDSRGGPYAVVRVSDRGIGISPGLSEKIFQEFYRADDSLSAKRSGAGLGLAIAREAASAHGGELFHSQRNGGGSVFTLRLPRSKEAD